MLGGSDSEKNYSNNFWDSPKLSNNSRFELLQDQESPPWKEIIVLAKKLEVVYDHFFISGTLYYDSMSQWENHAYAQSPHNSH